MGLLIKVSHCAVQLKARDEHERTSSEVWRVFVRGALCEAEITIKVLTFGHSERRPVVRLLKWTAFSAEELYPSVTVFRASQAKVLDETVGLIVSVTDREVRDVHFVVLHVEREVNRQIRTPVIDD